ncbi:MAG TPA: lysophospholipid acyltransferase family protein [Polyangiaceae bacterium]|nr:lysophospholipid acyltransferase family protein [Polyangiaceae bacterium]
MRTTQALARWSRDAARDALPLAQRVVATAAQGAEAAWRTFIGQQIEARLARVPVHAGPGGVDPFGLDLEWGKYVLAAVAFLHRKYFRTEVHGIEHVPAGRVLLIANHSGQVPIDAAMIGASMFFDAEPPRILRSMVEKWSQTLPFVSVLFTRMGQVVGVPENARRLLEFGEAVLVFPEGAKGISKPFRQRYQLTEFGLGFMRLALETETPIVPVAVIGAEEQYINLTNVGAVAKKLGMPSFPVIPQLLVPGLQLPLPTKYRIYFGEPMRFYGDPDDDDAIIEEKVWVVKATVQSMMNRGLKERRGVFT